MNFIDKQKQYMINYLNKNYDNKPIYYGMGIGMGYFVLGRKNSERTEAIVLSYDDHDYKEQSDKFTAGFQLLEEKKASLPTKGATYTIDGYYAQK